MLLSLAAKAITTSSFTLNGGRSRDSFHGCTASSICTLSDNLVFNSILMAAFPVLSISCFAQVVVAWYCEHEWKGVVRGEGVD